MNIKKTNSNRVSSTSHYTKQNALQLALQKMTRESCGNRVGGEGVINVCPRGGAHCPGITLCRSPEQICSWYCVAAIHRQHWKNSQQAHNGNSLSVYQLAASFGQSGDRSRSVCLTRFEPVLSVDYSAIAGHSAGAPLVKTVFRTSPIGKRFVPH